jgi:GGDEF domain-containing protein
MACALAASAATERDELQIAEVRAWAGPTQQASLQKIQNQALKQWLPGAVQPLGPGQSLWLAVKFSQPVQGAGQHLLELPLPILDQVSVWQSAPGGGWAEERAGDRVPMSEWPIAGRYPTFALHEGAQQVYVHVRHATPIVVPLQVTSLQAHAQRAQLEYLGLGMCMGFMCLLVSGSFMRAWVLRDPNFLMFSAYSLVSMLAAAATTGIAAHILWGDAGAWVDAAPGCLAILGGTIACYLTAQLATTSHSTRFVAQALRVLAWTGPPLALGYCFVERRLGLVLLGMYLLSASVFGITAAVITWQRGDAVGRWMLFGSTPLAAAVLVSVARSLSWVGTSWLTEYALVMALMLDLPLLLGAIRRRTRERRSAVLRQIASQDHDPLTGLAKAPLFKARVQQAVMRYERHREPAAVVMVEVTNLDAIGHALGGEAAEEALLRAVIKLRGIVRDFDTAGRLAPARFGLLIEGATTQDAVTLFGSRLVAAGLIRDEDGAPELRFHVVAVLLSQHVASAESLLRDLDAMLSAMGPHTRRPIRFLTAADLPVADVPSDPPQDEPAGATTVVS